MNRRKTWLWLAAVLILLSALTSCTASTKTTAPSPTTQVTTTVAATAKPSETTIAKTDAKTEQTTTKPVTTTVATTTVAPTTTTVQTTAPEARITLSVVSTDAGIAIPDDVDRSNNKYVNIAKEFANADVNYEIIAWADYQTRLNMLLVSGKYPDILHTAYNENVNEIESKGAFVNLLPYFEKSTIVQKFIDKDDFLERMQDRKTNEYYSIPMSNRGEGYPDGTWVRARYDLLQKYNEGKWPKTIDEWAEVARKVKEGNPNAKPFSAWCPGTMIFQYNKQFWFAFGVESNLQTILQEDNTYKFNVQDPDYKRAMEFHRKLYNDGLLSQTFATNTDYAVLRSDYDNNDLLVWSDHIQQMFPPDPMALQKTARPDMVWICAPPLETYPVPREKAMKFNYKRDTFDAGHRVHISKSSKYPDRAWRFIGGLCSEELYDLAFWGTKGEEYTVNSDGSRSIVHEKYIEPHSRYGIVYAIMMGYGQGRGALIQDLIDQTKAAMPDKLPLIEMHQANAAAVSKEATKVPYIRLGDLLSDKVSTKSDEAQGVATSLTVKYIMGRINMNEYDAGIAQFLTDYQYMLDERTQAYKDRYIDKTK